MTKIEVTADRNIAENYTLKEDATFTGTGSSKTITLTPRTEAAITASRWRMMQLTKPVLLVVCSWLS